MSRIKDLLAEHLNVDVSQETLEKIEQFSELKNFSANDIVYREHENSKHFYLVVSGQVDVQYLMKNGRRKTMDTCLKGDQLLWSALVEPHESNSIGICRAETELLSIDGEKLLEICQKDTAFGFHLMSRVASVIRRRLQATRKLLTFYNT
ncbi:MAG: cyclic nucleotide-binding domain-containing protein [Planctomycetia bacterium]|nr:cyclic nucleotide-binding domain-containing protein [Planctomycetia bacterium]